MPITAPCPSCRHDLCINQKPVSRQPTGRLTVFTWGYWGWGTSTKKLLEAMDAAEDARGFKPPFFVDIRFRRSGKAPEFVGRRFERLVTRNCTEDRYKWMYCLGNRGIETGGYDIVDVGAVEKLLDLAIDCAGRNQRLLFFCACVFPKWHRYPLDEDYRLPCHRDQVAELLCKSAGKRGLDVEVVEWPGFEQTDQIALEVSSDVFRKPRKTLPLTDEHLEQFGLAYFASLPWGTVATLHSGPASIAVMTGPVQIKKGQWVLPIPERAETPDDLARPVKTFRQKAGLNPRSTKKDETKPAHRRRTAQTTPARAVRTSTLSGSTTLTGAEIWAALGVPDARTKKRRR